MSDQQQKQEEAPRRQFVNFGFYKVDPGWRRLLEKERRYSVPEEKRTARYICVLALARRNKLVALFSDSCEGRILTEHRGRGGFGYDPLFYFPPLEKTLAEVSETEKNLHSHRGKAFRKLLSYLKEHNL